LLEKFGCPRTKSAGWPKLKLLALTQLSTR
jgi:hypothetical protein